METEKNFKLSFRSSLSAIALFAVGFAAFILSYSSLATWVLKDFWPEAVTIIPWLFPVVTYLMLQHMVVNQHKGRLKVLWLFVAGMVLNQLTAVLVSAFLWGAYAMEIDVYNSGSLTAVSFLGFLKGFAKWYAIFGVISTWLAIGILYAKMRFRKKK